jgi:threonine/homoserine/homoserine lactone efflux protein
MTPDIIAGALTFAAAVVLLIITPGPGVLSTAGVGSAFGFRAGLRYVAGLFIGTNLVTFAVISGLAAIVLSLPWLRYVLMAASTGYLLFLASKIAFAGARIAFIETRTAPGLRAGVFLQMVNPKAYAVNSALITGFPFWAGNLAGETALKLLIMNAIWIPIHLGWLWAGVALRRLNLAPRTQRRINIVMACALLGVVALSAWSALA